VKYSRFELLTIGIGGVAILGTVAFAIHPRPDWIELVAQLLLLVVLVGAVHWGRNGGLVAALGATLLYVVLRLPSIVAVGLEAEVLELILIRTAAFGVIGIIGGEICGRIKYFFARLEDSLSIDEHSRVYNQRFLAQLLANSLASATRYGTRFSMATIELAPCLTSELRPSRQNSLVRTVADHIRNDVRLIDDVGRLDDGRFVLVLPHTPKDGGHIAAARVRAGVRDLLGAKDESVTATVYGSDEDADAIAAFVASIVPIGDQQASGS
jgi:GGDEF domain-containing protein